MNPDFLKAVMALQAKIKELKAQGVRVSGDNIDEFLKAQTSGQYGLADYRKIQGNDAANMIRSFGYGISANQLDNILGIFSKPAADESRARQEAYSEYHPLHAITGELLGGLATGKAMEAPLGAILGKANTVGRAALHAGAAGAVYGGVDAEGRADNASLGEKVQATAVGAGLGGVLGGALGAGFAGGAKVLSRDGAATNRILSAIKKDGGWDALRANLADMVKAGRGKDVTLADLGPHLRQSLDFAVNESDQVLVPTVELMQARTAERAARLLSDVRTNLGRPAKLIGEQPNLTPDQARSGEPDFLLRQRQLAKHTSNEGGRLYDELAAQNPDFNVNELPLDKPKIARLWQDARLAGNIGSEGSPLNDLIQTLTKSNPGMKPAEIQQAARSVAASSTKDAVSSGMPSAFTPKERPVTLDDLTGLRRALEGQAKTAFKAGNGPMGYAMAGVKGEVDNALEAGAPGYRGVRAAYKGMKDLERGVEEGHDWWFKADKRELARVVTDKTAQPGALDEFRHGIASGLVEKLQGTASNRDAARELVQGGSDLQAKLQLIFGDESTFQSFMQRVKAERTLGELAQTFSNSATSRRIASRGIDPASIGMDLVTRGPSGALGALKSVGRAALLRRTAEKMGPSLLTQGAPDIASLIARLTGASPLASSALLSRAPTGLMSILPFLSDNGQ